MNLQEVPSNWQKLPLGEVFEIARGGSPRPIKHFMTADRSGINWIKIGDTKNSTKYIFSTKERIRKEGIKKSQLVVEDDFILSNSMSFGRPYIMKTTGCIHDGWLLLRKRLDNISVDFMYYLLSSDLIKNQFSNKAAGSTVQNLNIKLVSTVQALIPTYSEQQKIADILSTVDEKIELIDQQIAETEALKKGLMQRLLTKGIGHTEFKDSPLGVIPMGWKVEKLQKIAEIKGGKRIPKGKVLSEEPNNHPYLRVADMFYGGVSTANLLYVPDSVFPAISRYTVSKKDLFITVAGTLGIVGSIPAELDGANLTENADKITNIKIDRKFLLHVLLSPIIQDAILRERTNNAQSKLALTRIRSFLIPIPPREEQEQISEILDNLIEKVKVQNAKKKEYQSLKKALMQQLLTGKIRVKTLVEA